VSLLFALRFGTVGELVFTVVGIAGMISPFLWCYFCYPERWLLILSILVSMTLIVTGYKHLNNIKGSAVQQ
jgi:hypothetical protein